jgi:sodium-dependent dicarboxylate transporter 2/3/5
VVVLLAPALAGMPAAARRAAAVTALVASWWISGCIPIPATSLVPLALFPLLGVLSSRETASVYANENIFLFMGGFILALGMERWGLHRRIALAIIHAVGAGPRRMVLGFMAAAAFLSLWISNTATALMMLPIGLAVIRAVGQSGGEAYRDPVRRRAFGAALMLGIAYASSIGGVGTPIGTPPNIAFGRILDILYPEPVKLGAPAGGTFRATPRPEGWPRVAPGTVVGELLGEEERIEVRAGIEGDVLRILAPEGTPVTPGQGLLLIRPSEGPPAFEIPFGLWTLTFLPLVVVFLPLAWLVLVRLTCRVPASSSGVGRETIVEQRRALGPMSPAERRMGLIFLATALLWIFRRDLTLGPLALPGWAGLLEGLFGPVFRAGDLGDATVAVSMALLAFLVPSGERDEKGRALPLMSWETAVRLPWGILLLFGGGFAVASAFEKTGLSAWLGESFGGLGITSPLLLTAGACLLMTFLTELTSNTATTQVMLPILAGAAASCGVHPLMLMIPATLSASCAFMLPIATPPNAIIFGSGQVEMARMVRTGLILNLLGVVLVTLVFTFVTAPLLGIDPGVLPEWALPPLPSSP